MTSGAGREALAYANIETSFDGGMHLVARMRDRRSAEAAAQVRRVIAGVQHDLPVAVVPWAEAINNMSEYQTPRFQSIVLGAVATLAVTLAALGVFGVVSHSTRRCMREIAIRLALGSTPEAIVRRLTLRMAWPVVLGLAAGLMTIWPMTRILMAHLVGFAGWEVSVLATSAAIIALVAMIATYVPVRRASRLFPMTVLRNE